MPQKKFGSLHTKKKLDCLEKYLRAYLNVFKNKNWARTVYVDAFAGTGEIPTASGYDELPLGLDDRDFMVGSVQRALGISESFHEYVFIEKRRDNAKSLEKIKKEHPEKKIEVRNCDANDELNRLCTETNWEKCRAVVFLDPFGSQVEWRTLEALAATRAVDLWYLFPAGLSVHRQMSSEGGVHYTHEESLNRIFGSSEWRTKFIDTVEGDVDLFGQTSVGQVKIATQESVTKYMHERMATIFKGGVLDEWMPLGRNSGHWYSLMFACANPSPNANSLAMKLARAVMRSGRRGRSK